MAVNTKMAVFWVAAKFTNVSEVLAASIIRAMTALQPRRQPSSTLLVITRVADQVHL
jgi:hypothetical protein